MVGTRHVVLSGTAALFAVMAALQLGAPGAQPVGAGEGSGTGGATEARFVYDPVAGRCVDGEGNTGYNPTDLVAILTTRVGDCVDVSGLMLPGILDDLPAELDANYHDVSFRGANLNGTGFPPYAGPGSSDLSGADLRGAHDIYGMPIGGFVDDHTRYDEAHCRVSERDGRRAIECAPAPM